MLSSEQLRAIMPGLPAAKEQAFLPFLQAAIAEFAIETPARSAAFLAQVAHESGQFRFMEEIWGPTPAQQRYEPPSSLATTLGKKPELAKDLSLASVLEIDFPNDVKRAAAEILPMLQPMVGAGR